MRLLLDTHVALWAITDDRRLPRAARALIASSENSIHVSAVTVWEIALEHARYPADMPVSGGDALRWFRESGYPMLDVTPDHAAHLESLPRLHADPFDRMLVAQALVEPLRLMTRDADVARYGEMIMLI